MINAPVRYKCTANTSEHINWFDIGNCFQELEFQLAFRSK